MRINSCLLWLCRRLTWGVLAMACLAVCSVVFPPVPAEAGSVVIPAWSFARGNVVIHANPDEYADAGPVVGSGPRQAWGWRVEYDIEVPVSGTYALQICYAAAEARPVEIFVNNRRLTKFCTGVTFSPASAGQADELTWKSSGAKWECVRNYFENPQNLSLTKGKKKVMFTRRRGPLPHLVALRLDTPEEFPEDWKQPKYKVKDLESIPAEYRAAFQTPGAGETALQIPIEDTARPEVAASLTIPAWTFDRGNAWIYASPDQYADAGPIIGSKSQTAEEGVIEYDVDFPVDAEYILSVVRSLAGLL